MKRKLGIALTLLIVPCFSGAQNPDVLVTLDARIQWRDQAEGKDVLRAYDLLGRHSVVALLFSLEPGFDVTFSERFQRIPGDGDNENLDEYFIEDKGYWRFGKQYVPFGRNMVVRESLYSGRLNSRLGEQEIPATLCYVDGGRRRANGFVARVGGKFGISVAVGERFAQNASSLAVIRRPEESLGSGHGYGRLYGLDFNLKLAPQVQLEFDHVSFRKGETPLDVPMDVTDFAIVLRISTAKRAEFAISREWRSNLTMLRLAGEYPIYDGVTIEPMVRSRNGHFYDASISIRIKP